MVMAMHGSIQECNHIPEYIDLEVIILYKFVILFPLKK